MVSSGRDWRRINGLQLESIGCFVELSHHWSGKLLPNLLFHVMTTLTVWAVIGCNNIIYWGNSCNFLPFFRIFTKTKVKFRRYSGNFVIWSLSGISLKAIFTRQVNKMNPLIMSLEDMVHPKFCLSIWCCNGKTIHKISLEPLKWW